MRGIVITHPVDGIFIGNAMGLGLWSKMEDGGQTCVCTFESETQAREHVRGWLSGNDDAIYGYVELETEHEMYATIDELKVAGLESQLGLLVCTANVPGMGHA